MDVRNALDELGLAAGADPAEVRAAYRRLLRRHHPDVAGAAGAARTTALIEAYQVLLVAGTEVTDPTVDDPSVADPSVVDPEPADPEPAAAAPDTTSRPPDVGASDASGEPFDAGELGEDAIAVFAPADETFLLLHEAAGRIGEIAYVDHHLGILETILRFEGGPTCSLVLTLQGRAEYTEVFCTMESIEAGPTPSIAPAIAALVDELQAAP